MCYQQCYKASSGFPGKNGMYTKYVAGILLAFSGAENVLVKILVTCYVCDDYNCFRTLVSHSGHVHILHIPPCGNVFHVLIIQENSTICDRWSACSYPY